MTRLNPATYPVPDPGSTLGFAMGDLPDAPYYVSAVDSFMSGWGPVVNMRNVMVFTADSAGEARVVARNLRDRPEMESIRIHRTPPEPEPKTLYSIRTKSSPWIKNFYDRDRPFRENGRDRKRNPLDEEIRALERDYLTTGDRATLERYMAAIERSGRTPKEIGQAVSDLIGKRGKKPALWVQILLDMGAHHGNGLRSVKDAKRVARLTKRIAGVSRPEEFYSSDYERNVEAVMDEIDSLLETFGVEALSSELVAGPGGFWMDTLALYANTGDGYDTTVVYDTREDEFFLGSPYSFLEEVEAREGVEEEEPGESGS